MVAEHVLDYSEIDELDEISGDEQLTLIWCDTHQEHEWHWLMRWDVSPVYRRQCQERWDHKQWEHEWPDASFYHDIGLENG